MKLILIEPLNRTSIIRRKRSFLQKIPLNTYFNMPALALGILAALTPDNWDVKILQEPADTIEYDEEVDLVGISAATHTAKRAYEIGDEFRKRGKKVIMGGIHPSVMTEESLQHCDSVCIGEAETVWKKILKDVEKGKLTQTYRAENHFDLKEYAPPKRELMPDHKSIFYKTKTLEASRGCPHDCDFCSVSIIHGRKIRYRPIENLISEIEHLENSHLFFVDNNIIANPERAKQLFREIIPLKKRWTGQATISIAKDRELLKLASDSGCYGLLVGLESLAKEGFDKYQKNLRNMEELHEALRIIKEHGIGILAHMVFGDDFETKETIQETIENLMKLDVVTANLGILVPYPGTTLASKLKEQNRILTWDWDYYDIHHLVFQPKNFSCEEFLEQMQNIRKRYFSVKNILSRSISHRSPNVLGHNITSCSHNRVNHNLEMVESFNEQLLDYPRSMGSSE
jgi:radical SAM superfamily enzyme YgiQ (UPF0313 family)